jgi:hypothetical protein
MSERCCEALQAIVNRELDDVKLLREHREIAVAYALDLCTEQRAEAPPWLLAEARDVVIELLKREKPERMGRAGSCISRFRQDQWELERWDAVLGVREFRGKIRRNAQILEKDPRFAKTQKATVGWVEKWTKWLSFGTFGCASMRLAGRDARLGAEGMRGSYRRVNRHFQEVERSDRYFVFPDAFLKRLGLPGLHDYKGGTKVFEIFNLTP